MRSRPDQMRVLLYSHDTVGLGHLRRNQAIACGLARKLAEPTILMVSGARHCTMFDIPKCVDFVTIPALKKTSSGSYLARSSGLQMPQTIALRSDILRSVAHSYQPDVLVVDKVPRGVHGELDATLKLLRAEGRTRCVLGLRDILDEPSVVQREWARDANDQAIEEYYDAVWVYGDQRVCDVASEYRFAASTAAKITYAGYLDRTEVEGDCCSSESAEVEALELNSKKFVLCMVGGGEDGALLATTFAQAELPTDTFGVILTGPFMPAELREYLHDRARRNPRLHVLDFLKRPEWLLSRAERVIAMGGYNTVCEVLSRRKLALIVPRVTPRTEQLIRAERLRDLGLVHMLHPSELRADELTAWLQRSVTPLADARQRIDLGGLSRVSHLLAELVDDPAYNYRPRRQASSHHATVGAGEDLP